MIKLIYIRGISTYDTPYFNSKLEQYDFFDDIEGVEIEAYYPPHFTNTIKLDRDDVDDISQYNYLILYFNNKNYFYFLDSINYINEDVYEVKIIMDTIQTYMFDIVWNESLVSRKSIKRWNNSKINRDYIRENLSQTSKKLLSYNTYDTDGFYILQSSYNYMNDTEAYPLTSVSNTNTISNGCYYYLIPIPKRRGQYIKVKHFYNLEHSNDYSIIGGNCFIDSFLADMVDDPYTINIYYVNNLQISSIVDVRQYADSSDPLAWVMEIYDTNNSRFYNAGAYAGCMRVPNDYSASDPFASSTLYCGFMITSINLTFNKYTQPLAMRTENGVFLHNTGTNVDFNIKYIPQLVDENYFEIAFGERMGTTNFPLHYSESLSFDLYCGYDIYSGYRYYKIEEHNITNDKYLTTTVISTKETLDLYTDAWSTYQAQHKGDLTIGIKSQIAKNIYSGVAGAVNSSSFITRGNDNVGGNPSAGEYYGFNMVSSKISVANALISTAAIRSELWQTQDNMESTPDVSRCGNEFFGDLANNSLKTIATIMISEDIESVGRKLEYHGYKVCEYIRGNLFEECNIRYYYNIIKVDNMYIDLSVLTTYDILNEIKSRFISGIRLWNMEHNSYITEGLQYDNVEKEERV